AYLCGRRDDPLLSLHDAYAKLGASRVERAAAYRSLLREALPDEDLQAIRSSLQQQRAWDRFPRHGRSQDPALRRHSPRSSASRRVRLRQVNLTLLLSALWSRKRRAARSRPARRVSGAACPCAPGAAAACAAAPRTAR